MATLNLLTDQAADGNGDAVNLPRPGNGYVLYQVDLNDNVTTATVVIQGRINPNLAWMDLVTVTEAEGDSIGFVANCPHMRATLADLAGVDAAVSVAVYADKDG